MPTTIPPSPSSGRRPGNSRDLEGRGSGKRLMPAWLAGVPIVAAIVLLLSALALLKVGGRTDSTRDPPAPVPSPSLQRP